MARKSPEISATALAVGTRRKGNDGEMWEIIKAINGVQRWKRIVKSKSTKKPAKGLVKCGTVRKPSPKRTAKSSPATSSHAKSSPARSSPAANKLIKYNDEYMDTVKHYTNSDEMLRNTNAFVKYLIPFFKDLNAHNIYTFIYPLTVSFADDAWDIASEQLKKLGLDPEKVPYVFYLQPSETNMYLKHNLRRDQLGTVKSLLEKHFDKHFIWDGSNNKSIQIALKGTKPKREITFHELVVKVIRKDFDIASHTKGTYDVPSKVVLKRGDKATIDRLRKTMNSYKFNESKRKSPHVREDEFRIEGKTVLFNVADGMSMVIFDLLEARLSKPASKK